MGAAVALCYFVAVFTTVIIFRVRADLGFWHGLKVVGEGGVGLEWLLIAVVSAMFWPITLVIWLIRGRPEPRIVFNDKAVERQRRLSGA